MTCVPSDPRFRLLNYLVGWDAAPSANPTHLIGFDDAEGVRLAGGQAGLSAGDLDPFLPPPRVARSCDRCDWVLATPPAPKTRILTLNGCDNTWQELWKQAPVPFDGAVAVAVDRHRIAIVDAAAGRVWVMLLKGAQIIAEIAVTAPRDVSFGPNGDLVVATENGCSLVRFSFNGRPFGDWPAAIPNERIARLAHDRQGLVWLAVDVGVGRYALFSQAKGSFDFEQRDLEALSAAFERTDAQRSDTGGFCLRRGQVDGTEGTLCWSWFGRPLAAECIAPASTGSFSKQGQVLTEALDSGIPRCRWHRLRVDADVPAGTRISLAVATSENPAPAPQGNAHGKWAGFDAGVPHESDWQVVAPGQSDMLITKPAGRYLFLRLRLEGNGSATPHVRQIHLDFPRTTSADQLPAVYREDPTAGDFTERFLALFDATLGTVDQAVARFPALIKGAEARAEVLPWIARFLSVSLDQTWDAETRRRMLAAAPRLFRLRGTRDGLAQSIRLAFDMPHDPAIIEHGLNRAWGALGGQGASAAARAQLGATRLFSRRQTRMVLGASPVGTTQIRSFGSPAEDPHATGAFRFSVGLPAVTDQSPDVALEAMARLIEGQKPAHTLSNPWIGGTSGFRVDGQTRIGVDTVLRFPDPATLGSTGARLSASAILGGQSPPGPVLGVTSHVTRPSLQGIPVISRPECTS